MIDIRATPSGQPALAVPAEPFGLVATRVDQAQVRARTWANLLDSLVDHETPDQRWLRNAAQRLRDNPDLEPSHD